MLIVCLINPQNLSELTVYLVYENPILNFHEPSSHPLLPYIFQMSLSDPALFHAVQTAGATSMLFRTQTKELGATAMVNKGNAIRLLNEKLQKPSEAANDAATFITIMMLSALEVRPTSFNTYLTASINSNSIICKIVLATKHT